MILQEVKTGKHEVVKEAVKEVASERNSLKAEVSSLTQKVSDVESQLQQVARERKAAGQQLAAGKKEVQVCNTPFLDMSLAAVVAFCWSHPGLGPAG